MRKNIIIFSWTTRGRFCLAVGGFKRQTDLSRFLVSPHGNLGPGRSRHRRRPRFPLPDDADDLGVREQDHRDGDDVLKKGHFHQHS